MIWQLEDETLKILEQINFDLNKSVKVDSLPTYLLKWRCKVWEKAYSGNFTGQSQFTKSTKWDDYAGHKRFAMRLVHRLVNDMMDN
jgi:hypothetical protein